MSFNDDEPIALLPDVPAGDNSTTVVAGKVKMTVINNPDAPLEETKLKVMLKLTGSGGGNDRSGVDLVTVLDVSGSMGRAKLEKMKLAMQFLIKKLSPIDRLSIVSFSDNATRLCPLRQITETSQPEMEGLVKALHSGGNTNIAAGLHNAMKILEDRRLKSGRVIAVMVMSDGEETIGKAAFVDVGSVPVYTFGFGIGHDPKVLKAIADNSKGGTFSDVQNEDNLSIAFSQCLAGLLTVVVQDLRLTVAEEKNESTVHKVSAGNYPQARDNGTSSVTISFGDLYDKEVRKIIVDLILPAVEKKVDPDILKVAYNYNTGVKRFEGNPFTVNVTRSGISQPEKEEVVEEENRLAVASMMKQARVMADGNKLDNAKDKLDEAQSMLADASSSDLMEALRSEVRQLARFMMSPEVYKNNGRSFALSSETSHERQRFAARGDDPEKLRIFATPRMDTYLEQAMAFDEDPSEPVPSADDDVKKEIAADPLGPIAGALSYYLQTAIQALQSVDKIINATRS